MAAGTVEECDRLIDMINTMLMITKAESGLHRLDEQEVTSLAWSAMPVSCWRLWLRIKA